MTDQGKPTTEDMLSLLLSMHEYQSSPLTPLGEMQYEAIIARLSEYDRLADRLAKAEQERDGYRVSRDELSKLLYKRDLENKALKEEVEAMKPSCLACFGSGKAQTKPTIICPKCGGTGKEWSVAWKARAEKAEAYNTVLQVARDTAVHAFGEANDKAEKAEAALAEARPLLEAVDASAWLVEEQDFSDGGEAIKEAALAYLAKKAKKEGK